MSKLTRENAILPFTAGEDLSNKVGYPVFLENGQIITCKDSTGLLPLGVLLHGAALGEQVSVALCVGLAGTVKLKLIAAASVAQTLMLADDVGGECTVKPTEAGERIEFALALEAGVAGELIEAALFKPVYSAT